MRWEDLMFEQDGSYDGWAAYAQSKLANILFSVELGRRLQGMGIAVTDPGFSNGEGGVNPRVWAENLLFEKIFAENCMKKKEI